MQFGQNPYQQYYQTPYRSLYPQVPAQQPMMQQPVQGYSQSSMPVSSREEALAMPADFSGAPMVFTDLSHGKIYVKQWDAQKGESNFMNFVPEPVKEPEQEKEKYVTASTFRQEMEKLYRELDKVRDMKGDMNHVHNADE